VVRGSSRVLPHGSQAFGAARESEALAMIVTGIP
jgi:hypothetical protein